ncbi:MAG: transposase [Rhodobacteraceae bacterium]|nr:transposase [Paracoccaceae bacterium]
MKGLQRLEGDGDGSVGGTAGSVSVHKHGAGAPQDSESPQSGSSRGRRTTKVHLGIDRNEMVNTVLFLILGHVADCAQAKALLAYLKGDETVISGKACDTDAGSGLIESVCARVEIPSKSNRKSPRPLDREIYRRRNLVERFFGRAKEFRRVATRYDKTGCNFLSAMRLAVSWFLLRRIAHQLFESSTQCAAQ